VGSWSQEARAALMQAPQPRSPPRVIVGVGIAPAPGAQRPDLRRHAPHSKLRVGVLLLLLAPTAPRAVSAFLASGTEHGAGIGAAEGSQDRSRVAASKLPRLSPDGPGRQISTGQWPVPGPGPCHVPIRRRLSMEGVQGSVGGKSNDRGACGVVADRAPATRADRRIDPADMRAGGHERRRSIGRAPPTRPAAEPLRSCGEPVALPRNPGRARRRFPKRDCGTRDAETVPRGKRCRASDLPRIWAQLTWTRGGEPCRPAGGVAGRGRQRGRPPGARDGHCVPRPKGGPGPERGGNAGDRDVGPVGAGGGATGPGGSRAGPGSLLGGIHHDGLLLSCAAVAVLDGVGQERARRLGPVIPSGWLSVHPRLRTTRHGHPAHWPVAQADQNGRLPDPSTDHPSPTPRRAARWRIIAESSVRPRWARMRAPARQP